VGTLALCLPYAFTMTDALRTLLAGHDRAEPLPGLALESLHLQLLDRREIGRAGLDLGARQIDADLEVQVRCLLHHIRAGEIVSALPQHLFEALGRTIAEYGAGVVLVTFRVPFGHERAPF